MKKTLLISGLLLSSLFSVNAQVTFETAQGFNVGNLAGQNGWGASAAAPTSSKISNLFAKTGTQSLQVIGLNGSHTALVGAFSPVSVINNPVVTVMYDVNFSDFSTSSSDFYFGTQSPSQQKATARIHFDFSGAITILDIDPASTTGALYFAETDAQLVAGQWYNVKIVHDFGAGIIDYYLDNEMIYSGSVFGATNVEQATFLNDNYSSAAYIDNYVAVAGLGVNNNVVASKLSVYPNPAKNLINISNSDNVSLTNATITDLNGRTVKSVELNGATQINISDLASGVYMMNINSDQGSVTKKIVKE
ncbi:T9SS type A sorting domain-containing protein [uncultured Flavobacterium sp.]|uniref:T9SS type A sorting domain-containing protein n=1 Tax=uncultured Flavobacterium sp. TaxID=165435 RepID=UPI0025FB5551|nr:T9SS type A sorting domain-containing protein [uncultured Flavobacterium sp.]